MRKAIQFSWQLTGILLAVLWLFQTPLWAAIYKWRDDQGKLHFTDSKSKIPLKYRENIQKFKGVVEPNPEPVAEPAESEKGGKEKEAVVSEPTAGEKKPAGEKKQKDSKLIVMLKETIKFLEDENRAHQRLIGSVEPTKKNGRYYVSTILKGIATRKPMIKKLKGFNNSSLKRTRRFLKSSYFTYKREASVFESEQVKVGDDEYLVRILSLKELLKREIKSKEKIIKKLKSALKE